jgi:hypothetical protein
VVGGGVLVGVAALVAAIAGLSSSSSHSTSASGGAATLRVSTEAWQLPSPLSRTVVFPLDGHLGVFGGLGSANATTPAITEIDPSNGKAEPSGTLAVAVHDAAGAVIGKSDYVFGGGAQQVSGAVQAFSTNAPGVAASRAATVATLPSPRADLATVTVGGTVVLVGGYDGTNFLPDVLTTTDGRTFNVVARLPQPVRYPAVAAVGHKVYVMGGELPGNAGDATTIQVVDLDAHTATVVGHTPSGLSHAVAVSLGSRVYVFGGRSGGHAIDTVSELDPGRLTLDPVSRLPVVASDLAVATFGDAAYLVGGENDHQDPQTTVMVARLEARQPSITAVKSPFKGKLLIADRGNNRLLLVDANKRVHWVFPSPSAPAPAQGFYFPDDAFFVKHGTAILTNEEDQHTILELAFPSGKLLASYGHPNLPGRAPGFLNQPDDASLLKNGQVTVADAKNCRILFLNPDFTYASEIGQTGRCQHDPPNDIAYPNGDTPLADGNVLVSEINGSIVDELTPAGHVVWSLHLPLAYPSDPQQIGPDLYLIADYTRPGGLYEFTREGRIVFSYSFPSGDQMLDHPSLVERLPNGLLCVNDDYRHRVVIIDPTTKQIVWQYGRTDIPGTTPGLLNTPDGFDLLAPINTTPTHPQTG